MGGGGGEERRAGLRRERLRFTRTRVGNHTGTAQTQARVAVRTFTSSPESENPLRLVQRQAVPVVLPRATLRTSQGVIQDQSWAAQVMFHTMQ